jgi:hypothetical protein
VKNIVLLVLLAGCAGANPSPPPGYPIGKGPAACSGEINPDNLTLPSADLKSSPVAVYAERCDGGLYLLHLQRDESLLKINASWWLESLDSVALEPDGKSLRVSARFITGIGPTGTVPFNVEFRITRSAAGQWQSEQLPIDNNAPLELQPGVLEIANLAQLNAARLKYRHAPISLRPNFADRRLVLKSLWLTSGSAEVTDIRVHRNDRGYFITYNVEAPRIGTTDMKHVVLHVELPKDHRYASFADPELNATRVRVPTGVLENATFFGALPP